MSMQDQESGIALRPRSSETVSLNVPDDTFAQLERVAEIRGMSLPGLLKLYIGHGVRQDLSRLYSERVLDKTAEVLSRHIESEVKLSAILREIQEEAVP